MTKKITTTVVMVCVTTLLLCWIMCMGYLHNYFGKIQRQEQKTALVLVAKGVESQGIDFFQNLPMIEYRVTWVSADGKVLYDNHRNVETMENHLERQEIGLAQQNGFAEVVRFSDTMMEKTLYMAQRLKDSSILRLSLSRQTVWSLTIRALPPIVLILVLAVALCSALARNLAKKIVSPLEHLQLDHPLNNDVYEELSPLLIQLDKQNKEISARIQEITQKNAEINHITQNIRDGILIFHTNKKILSVNKRAEEIFFCKAGDYFLDFCHELTYRKCMEQAFLGEAVSFILEIGSCIYRMVATPTEITVGENAVFLFVSDVTEEELSQTMRREFSANVSHELRTPLASIMGTAEILQYGIVQSQDIPEFAGKIYTESKRLLTLIEDIIKLSRLDEGVVDSQMQEVDLLEICKSVKQSLDTKATESQIQLNVVGEESLYVVGYPHVLYEMIFNLAENSIKYNCPKGYVEIKVLPKTRCVMVCDNGIGIAKEDSDRVFERFYRVDKSHSRATGGTGLGLSIVKHSAKLHHAEVQLKSTLNKGTEISVTFPYKP